jgi:periplasmic protein TonB
VNEISRPFAVSIAAHLGLIALLLLLPRTAPTPPKIDLSNAVSVVFAPAPSPPAPAQPAPQPPPPPVAEQPPPPTPEPPPPPQIVEQPPPPPAPVAETPPPPPKPEPKPEPKPIPKPRPRPTQQAQQSMPELPLPLPMPSQAAPQNTPQTASIPSPPPGPTISPDYRTVLSSWLETHKRYPEEARQRGEEGRAVLRFRVDRSGRVLDYAVVSSSGFADLDQAVETMMRGAVLPPFPPSMTTPEIEVSVTIRYGLAR